MFVKTDCKDVSVHFRILCTENAKALFRRGKAYVELSEATKAREDLTRCSELDPSSAGTCAKLLAKLSEEQKKHHEQDKKIYGNMFGRNSTSSAKPGQDDTKEYIF